MRSLECDSENVQRGDIYKTKKLAQSSEEANLKKAIFIAVLLIVGVNVFAFYYRQGMQNYATIQDYNNNSP